MPTKPARPCAQPGCPRTAVAHGRCAQHQLPRRYDLARGTPAERGYDAQWRVDRDAYLGAHPFCTGLLVRQADGSYRRTHAEGCNGVATEVDHIVPLSQGGSNTWANYQALSHACHSRKTAQQDGGFGNRIRG